MSNTKPASVMRRPASRASSRPLSDRSTSVHPVNRFSLFQVLSPWRNRTTLYMAIQLPKRGLAGVAPPSAELLLNPEQLVVLRHTIGAAGGARLDLADAGADRE